MATDAYGIPYALFWFVRNNLQEMSFYKNKAKLQGGLGRGAVCTSWSKKHVIRLIFLWLTKSLENYFKLVWVFLCLSMYGEKYIHIAFGNRLLDRRGRRKGKKYSK
ncbi:hypothetical protein ACH5RR_023166 [Cinchona calisaya]|uniref:Uncharacterized protein n=1 Tax=Cinchona calisaya TaxID=153742 RepID=A0ABD2ZBE7_9GENT